MAPLALPLLGRTFRPADSAGVLLPGKTSFAYPLVSANPNRLGSLRERCSAVPDPLVARRASAASKAEQGLEGGPGLVSTVRPEDKLIEVDLELPPADSVMSPHKPVLKVADRPVGTPVTAPRAGKVVRPAAQSEVVRASFFVGELRLKIQKALGKRRSGHSFILQ